MLLDEYPFPALPTECSKHLFVCSGCTILPIWHWRASKTDFFEFSCSYARTSENTPSTHSGELAFLGDAPGFLVWDAPRCCRREHMQKAGAPWFVQHASRLSWGPSFSGV